MLLVRPAFLHEACFDTPLAGYPRFVARGQLDLQALSRSGKAVSAEVAFEVPDQVAPHRWLNSQAFDDGS